MVHEEGIQVNLGQSDIPYIPLLEFNTKPFLPNKKEWVVDNRQQILITIDQINAGRTNFIVINENTTLYLLGFLLSYGTVTTSTAGLISFSKLVNGIDEFIFKFRSQSGLNSQTFYLNFDMPLKFKGDMTLFLEHNVEGMNASSTIIGWIE